MNNANAGAGHTPEKMSDEEFNSLLIESVPEQYAPLITEGKTITILPEEGHNEGPLVLPMKPEQRIAEAKAYLEAITIAGPEDKANYNLIAAGVKSVTKWRTAIEKKRKELKRVALDYGKAVDGEAARLTQLVEEVEKPAKAKLEAIDNIIEEQRKAEQLRRHKLLTENGWQFTGSWYICTIYNYSLEQVNAASNETIDEWVAIGKTELERLEAERIRKEEEARKAAEAARLQAEENARLAKEAAELRAKLAALEAANKPEPEIIPVTSTEQAKEVAHELAKEVHRPTPRMFPGHPRPAGFEVPPASNPFAGTTIGPAITEPAEEKPFEKPLVGTVTAFDYKNGFNDCKQQVLAIFADGIKRTRDQFIQEINNLKANNG